MEEKTALKGKAAIRLEKIDAKNVRDVPELRVKREQKGFVASNDVSVVQACVAEGSGCRAFPFAIRNDRKAAGFLKL